MGDNALDADGQWFYFRIQGKAYAGASSSLKLFGLCTARSNSTRGERLASHPRMASSSPRPIRIPRITPVMICGGTFK